MELGNFLCVKLFKKCFNLGPHRLDWGQYLTDQININRGAKCRKWVDRKIKITGQTKSFLRRKEHWQNVHSLLNHKNKRKKLHCSYVNLNFRGTNFSTHSQKYVTVWKPPNHLWFSLIMVSKWIQYYIKKLLYSP